jgi:hypothetical protein
VKTGFHYVPVVYIQYTWSETWYVKNHIALGTLAAALMCTRTGPYAAAPCAFVAGFYGWDITTTVNAAIAHQKCLKMRIPLITGLAELTLAYDSYYVTCTS